MPLSLFVAVRPKLKSLSFDEGSFLGIIRVSTHDFVGEAFDFLARDEARGGTVGPLTFHRGVTI